MHPSLDRTGVLAPEMRIGDHQHFVVFQIRRQILLGQNVHGCLQMAQQQI